MIGLLLAACCGACLQEDEPTDPLGWARRLEDLDLSASWGDLSAEVHGELDLELLILKNQAPGVSLEDPVLRSNQYKRTRKEEGRQGVERLTIDLDGAFQTWLTYLVEARVDHGAPAEAGEAVGGRFEQYWVRATLPDSTLANLELGKFSAPLGNFIPRSSPRTNPFTTFPLMYDQVTTFMRKSDTAATILGRRDKPAVKDWRVPIYRELYGVGGMGFGTWEKLTYAVAVMNTAPASWVFDWPLYPGDFRNPNVYLHAGYAVDASLSVGASASRGPYDRGDAAGIPSGRTTGDYPQTLAGVDLHYAIGAVDVYAEAYFSRLRAPLVDDLDLWGWYVEGKYTFLPGLFGAVRVAELIFGSIDDATGIRHRWDRDQARVEWGGGYFFTRSFFVKATMQLNYTLGGPEPKDHMVVLQVGLGF